MPKQCRTFLFRGACRFGDGCHFSHANNNLSAEKKHHKTPPSSKNKVRPCRTYSSNGFCRSGDNCHFSHNNIRSDAKKHHSHKTPSSSRDTGQYCHSFLSRGTCRFEDRCHLSHVSTKGLWYDKHTVLCGLARDGVELVHCPRRKYCPTLGKGCPLAHYDPEHEIICNKIADCDEKTCLFSHNTPERANAMAAKRAKNNRKTEITSAMNNLDPEIFHSLSEWFRENMETKCEISKRGTIMTSKEPPSFLRGIQAVFPRNWVSIFDTLFNAENESLLRVKMLSLKKAFLIHMWGTQQDFIERGHPYTDMENNQKPFNTSIDDCYMMTTVISTTRFNKGIVGIVWSYAFEGNTEWCDGVKLVSEEAEIVSTRSTGCGAPGGA